MSHGENYSTVSEWLVNIYVINCCGDSLFNCGFFKYYHSYFILKHSLDSCRFYISSI